MNIHNCVSIICYPSVHLFLPFWRVCMEKVWKLFRFNSRATLVPHFRGMFCGTLEYHTRRVGQYILFIVLNTMEKWRNSGWVKENSYKNKLTYGHVFKCVPKYPIFGIQKFSKILMSHQLVPKFSEYVKIILWMQKTAFSP